MTTARLFLLVGALVHLVVSQQPRVVSPQQQKQDMSNRLQQADKGPPLPGDKSSAAATLSMIPSADHISVLDKVLFQLEKSSPIPGKEPAYVYGKKPSQPIKDLNTLAGIEQLWVNADGMRTRFQTTLQTISAQLASRGISSCFGVGDLKGCFRAAEKVVSDYKGDWSAVTDVVRGTIAFNTISDLIEGVILFNSRFPIVYAKNRFIATKVGGAKDLFTLFRDPVSNVIGELQFHTCCLVKRKESGHLLYEEARKIEARYLSPNNVKLNLVHMTFCAGVRNLFTTTEDKMKDENGKDIIIDTAAIQWSDIADEYQAKGSTVKAPDAALRNRKRRLSFSEQGEKAMKEIVTISNNYKRLVRDGKAQMSEPCLASDTCSGGGAVPMPSYLKCM